MQIQVDERTNEIKGLELIPQFPCITGETGSAAMAQRTNNMLLLEEYAQDDLP